MDVNDPVGFFTTVADKMLRASSVAWFQSDPTNYLITYFGIMPTNYVDGSGYGVTNVSAPSMTNQVPCFGITNIPVMENGQPAYTPAIQRLLQLSGNIFEATTTNFYPTVFRPIFQSDNCGNVFIIGFTNVWSGLGINTVTGADDPQLASPYDISFLLNFPTNTPISDANGFVNVYGVPWIIGAKKGFPNFNEFSMQDVVRVARKLQVVRQSTNSLPNATNQMYVFSVTNSLGVEFWNSYTNAYTNLAQNIQVVVNDVLSMRMALTNGQVLFADGKTMSQTYLLGGQTNFSVWPGNAFVIPYEANFTILPDSAYLFSPPQFYYVGDNPNPTYQSTSPAFPPLPQILLNVTNQLQAFILDNNHVVDYVHFSGPGTSRNLNSEFQNTNTTVVGLGTAPYYTNLVWSTVPDSTGLPLGIAIQIGISDGVISPVNTVFWKDVNAHAEIDGFRHFLNPANASLYGTQNNFMFSTNLAVQVPFTPVAITYEYTTFQANDPLVHYLKSDLNYSGYDPDHNSPLRTGVHAEPLNLASFPLLPNLGQINARYQPWGKTPPSGQAGVSQAFYDLSPYNLAFKDPLVKQSDDWDFPNGGGLPLTTLGQIHRGTPWQTVYLKASDILAELNPINPALGNVGTNTWAVWTSDADRFDAVNAAPVNDRQVIDVLIPLMNTNALGQLLPVNDRSLSNWAGLFGGMVVWTNSTALPQFKQYQPLTNGLLVIDPAGQGVVQMVTGINAIRAQFMNADGLVGMFEQVGDILSTPQLTEQSPFLNWNNTTQQQYGISDEVYEAIPAQLLPLLRPDSIGKLVQVNGAWNVQFSGSDGFAYALQASTNLIDWIDISTNYPVQGYFRAPISPLPNSPGQYYRSVLLP